MLNKLKHIVYVVFEDSNQIEECNFYTNNNNYEIKVGNDLFIIINKNINDDLPRKFYKKMFGTYDFSLAINRMNGAIYIAKFDKSSKLFDELNMNLIKLNSYVTNKYLKMLDMLVGSNNSYRILLHNATWVHLYENEIRYKSIIKNLIIQLNLDNKKIQFSQFGSREVTEWSNF